jgi:hypothetical protein
VGKLIVTEFVTLDGVAQAPGGPDEDRDRGFTHGGWQAPLLDQEASGVRDTLKVCPVSWLCPVTGWPLLKRPHVAVGVTEI